MSPKKTRAKSTHRPKPTRAAELLASMSIDELADTAGELVATAPKTADFLAGEIQNAASTKAPEIDS